MLLRIKQNRHRPPPPAASTRQSRKMPWASAIACVVVLVALAAACKLNSQQQQQQLQSPNLGRNAVNMEKNRVPDANAQIAMREQQTKKLSVEAANVERKRQISDDSAHLLKLATDLKAEVDKTSKDTLSLGVIRKADEIERLAHTVKDKMRLTMSAAN